LQHQLPDQTSQRAVCARYAQTRCKAVPPRGARSTTPCRPHKFVVNSLELKNVDRCRYLAASSRATQANTRTSEGAWVRRPRSSDRTPGASRQGLNSRPVTAKQPSVTPVALSVVPLRGAVLCFHVDKFSHLPWCSLLVAYPCRGTIFFCPTSRPWAASTGPVLTLPTAPPLR
jgi:hypothetical protein